MNNILGHWLLTRALTFANVAVNLQKLDSLSVIFFKKTISSFFYKFVSSPVCYSFFFSRGLYGTVSDLAGEYAKTS